MKAIKLNKIRNLIISILIVVVFMTVPLYFIYKNINYIIIRDIGNEAEKIATTISIFIEEDIEKFESLTKTLDISKESINEYYKDLRELLYNIRRSTDAKYIYVKRISSDKNIVYLVDGENENSENFSPLGSIEASNDYIELVYKTNARLSTGIEAYERWGELLTGYSPINGNNQEILGVVGVDISLEKIDSLRNPINRLIIIGGGILSLIGILILNYVLNAKCDVIDKDSLTGLLNKRNFDSYLKNAIKISKKKNKKLCLMMIDLDKFKEINDSYGHLLGDSVLKNIARLLLENTRSSDLCFRFGGDEFLVILPHTDKEQAMDVSNRIMKKTKELVNMESFEKNIGISLSIGLVEWDQGMEINELVEIADKNMYQSKNEKK